MKHRLSKTSKMIIAISSITLLMIILYILFAQYTIKEYEIISEETENLYAEKIISSSDRTLKSYINRYTQELEFLLRQSYFCEEEKRILEEGTPNDLLEFFQKNMIYKDLPYTSMIAIDNDTIILSYDLSKGQILPGDIITTINRNGCICAGKDGNAYLSFCKRSENGVVYGLFIELDDFFRETLGEYDQSEYYEISLYDANNGYFAYQEGNATYAIKENSEKIGEAHGLNYIKQTYDTGTISTSFYQNSGYISGESYRARIHSIPAPLTNNGRLSIAVSINYDVLSAPLHKVIQQTIYASIFVTAFLLICIFALFLILRKHNETLLQINALKEKNHELSLLHEQMNTNLHHQRLETIGTLTSGIAHEFNNLLTPIMGYSIMAIDKIDSEDSHDILQDYLTQIYDSASRAKTLIRRISDLSRKNSDLTMKPSLFDSMVKKGIETALAAKPTNIQVKIQLQAKDVSITANALQISQMVLNLVLNAVQALQHIPDGMITIHSYFKENKVFLSISDNGPGIAPEDHAKVFEPFYTTKETGKGTGLGLAIVQQIVEEHSGTIELQNSPERGASFLIAFPAQITVSSEALEDQL